jgi:hypothetical protein
MNAQLGLYKASSDLRAKDATIKDFKLEILICFNSSITKTLSPLTSNISFFSHLIVELSNFCEVGIPKWRVTNILCASKIKEQGVRI